MSIKDPGASSICPFQTLQEKETAGSMLFEIFLKPFTGVWNEFFPK